MHAFSNTIYLHRKDCKIPPKRYLIMIQNNTCMIACMHTLHVHVVTHVQLLYGGVEITDS